MDYTNAYLISESILTEYGIPLKGPMDVLSEVREKDDTYIVIRAVKKVHRVIDVRVQEEDV